MTAERFVVDTNVLISAALRETSTPRAVLRRIEDIRGALLFSDETFDELRTRLQRPRFTRYIDPEDRDVFLAQLLRISEWIAITNSKLGCRDEDDDKLLETALLGEADCLVTGDQDLLEMSPFRGIPIVSPAELLRSITATRVKMRSQYHASPHRHSATYPGPDSTAPREPGRANDDPSRIHSEDSTSSTRRT